MFINLHLMQYFRLEHGDLVSCRCFMTFYDDCE